MLVLHGLWSSGDGLCLWAEDSERPVTSHSQAVRSARPHPFAATSEALSILRDGRPSTVVLQLPSLLRSPLDSPELIRITPRRGSRAAPTLRAWTVPSVVLPAAGAATWLGQPDDARTDGVRWGASLRHLAEIAALAADLVDGGRVVPTLAHDGEGPIAGWRPVVRGPDALALQSLVRATPPVCRAQPGHDDPARLASAALTALTDALVRRRIAGLDLAPPRRGRRPRQLPAAEAWLTALTAPTGRFAADEAEVSALATSLQAWDEVGAGPAGPARATFRLSELEDDSLEHDGQPVTDPGWQVEFLLQSTADPSLLVPAERAWDDDGTLRRWLHRPQELLLGELGRASRVYPALGEALRQAHPSGLVLDAEGAVDFLSDQAPALDEAGFGVLLPSWWDRRARLGLRATASTPTDAAAATNGGFGRDQLCQFSWRLAVGDATLTDAEIAALAEAKAPLVRLRGQWVAVDHDQLQRGLEFLRRDRSATASVADVLRLATARGDDPALPLDVVSVDADGWLGALLEGTAAQSVRTVDPPDTFGATLRPYQGRGLSWLAFLAEVGLGACLADDMGLGKTVQLLALEAREHADHVGRGPTLLLCPTSLVGTWQREAARFAPELRVYAHHGRDRLGGDPLTDRVAETDLVITTYGTATRDVDELAGIAWHRVVLDEAQAIKNSRASASQAARRLPAAHRIALTGTPVENRLSELWSIMDFLNPGLLGPYERFRKQYAIPVERHGDTDVAERLRAITRPYLLRRLKTDPTIIDDLPDKIELKQYCRLTTEQASLYQSVVDDMLDKIANAEGIERRGNVLAAMAKLKQVCNHPAQLLHDRSAIGRRSGKIIRLEELLEEILAGGDRVLCFTQFTEFAELLIPHLAARFGTDIAYLHGGTPKKRRDELVERFQAGEGPAIFLLSLRAGGTGLTLTAANHVIHLDRWWNPAVENQATDRAFRIGQHRSVEVHKFICTGTLEERIDDMIEQKRALAEMVISDGEGWLTELSTTDLRDLFTLTAAGVDE